MPVRSCQKDGKPGFSWGDGYCYTYNPDDPKSRAAALEKAKRQGRAIKAQARTLEGRKL